jgi:hypothetical protein
VNELVFLPGHTGRLRTARDGHLIVGCVALVGDVVIRAINANAPEFVPLSALAAAPHKWNTKPVVIDHPTENGKQISANHPRVLEAQGVGTIANARIADGQLRVELHIDEVRAARAGAGRLLERLHAGEKLEVSVGCFVKTEPRSGTYGGKPYEEVWRHVEPDHIALLSAGIGACSVREHGCGASFVRVADAYVPDAYAPALAQLRAAQRPTFADQYRAARLAALDAEYAAADEPPSPPPVTDLSAFDAPNPYTAALKELHR